ncbi:MAG: redoxin domain-containing protein [bacterium]|nr:redoxin domain-containing protein [bacterium]
MQVFFVTSHECPIANAYAPTMASLAATWGQAVETWVVQADPDFTVPAARRHAEEHALPRPVLLDPRHELIRALGARMTPEAVVVRDDRVFYRGRIDDRWRELGMRAREAATHDLRDAVAAVCENHAVAERRTRVIGCHLPEPRR